MGGAEFIFLGGANDFVIFREKDLKVLHTYKTKW